MLVVDQRLVIAGARALCCLRLEAYGPVVGLDHLSCPGVRVQVVDEIAAAHDQHTAFARRCE